MFIHLYFISNYDASFRLQTMMLLAWEKTMGKISAGFYPRRANKLPFLCASSDFVSMLLHFHPS